MKTILNLAGQRVIPLSQCRARARARKNVRHILYVAILDRHDNRNHQRRRGKTCSFPRRVVTVQPATEILVSSVQRVDTVSRGIPGTNCSFTFCFLHTYMQIIADKSL